MKFVSYMDTSQQSKIRPQKPKPQSAHKIAKWLAVYVSSRGRKKIWGVRSPLPEASHQRRNFLALLMPSQAPPELQLCSTLDSQTKGARLPWPRPSADIGHTSGSQLLSPRLAYSPRKQNCRCSSDPIPRKRLTGPTMPTLPSDGVLKQI